MWRLYWRSDQIWNSANQATDSAPGAQGVRYEKKGGTMFKVAVLAVLIMSAVGLFGFAEEEMNDGSVPYSVDDVSLTQWWQPCRSDEVQCGPCDLRTGLMKCWRIVWLFPSCRSLKVASWWQRCDDPVPVRLELEPW